MKIFKYKSYNDYVNVQIEANKRKLNCSYVDPNSIQMLCDYIVNELDLKPNRVLCHGTRRGNELKYFENFLANHSIVIDILGTDISPTATKFDKTIQWDFHKVKTEWLSNFDIIYSNSFDHSPNPMDCLKSWMSCLSTDGVCIIEYSEECDTVSSKVDPLAATFDEYTKLIKDSGFNLLDVLRNDGIVDLGETYKGERIFFIITK